MPPPFNVLPSPKSLWYAWRWLRRRLCGQARASREHLRTIRVSSTQGQGPPRRTRARHCLSVVTEESEAG